MDFQTVPGDWKIVLSDQISYLWDHLMICSIHHNTYCTDCCNPQTCMLCNKIIETCKCTYDDFILNLTYNKYQILWSMIQEKR